MKKRKLGRSGLEVSPICFGGNVFGWTLDEPTSFEILDAFVAAGGNFAVELKLGPHSINLLAQASAG